MKYFLPLIAFMWTIPFSGAQVKSVLLLSDSLTAAAQIDLAAGKLDVKPIEESTLIKGLSLKLEYGELVIDYQLPEGKEEYNVHSPRVSLDGTPLEFLPQQIKGETGRIQAGETRRIRLTQLFENFINIQGTLEVTLIADQYGERDINCDENPPTFTAKQRIPYYVGAGAGVACIGLGQYFRVKSRDIYDNEYLLAPSKDDSEPLYKKANKNHHAYAVLTYGGAAILVADVVLYFLRYKSYQNRLEDYNRYCGKKTGFLFEPVLEIPSPASPNGQAGVKFTLNF